MTKKRIFFITLALYTILQCHSIHASEFYSQQSKIGLKDQIKAGSAVVFELKTNSILYDKDMHVKKYPASVTKIMTVLLTVEYFNGNFDRVLEVSDYAINSLVWDSSVMGLKIGEKRTVNELLYGLMLASGNDAAIVLAESISGSEDEFAKRMTERARELGALNTNFVNAHGLHDTNHYTTAYDIAIILQEAIKHDKILELISTPKFTLSATEQTEKEWEVKNTNKLINEGEYFTPEIIGGKTGFTDEAGHTLASYAKTDELELIIVTLQEEKLMPYIETRLLLFYCRDNFAYTEIINPNSYKTTIPVKGTIDGREVMLGTAELVPGESITMLFPRNLSLIDLNFNPITDYDKNYIEIGAVAGSLSIEYEGTKLAETELKSISRVDSAPFFSKIKLEETRVEDNQNSSVPAFAPSIDTLSVTESLIKSYSSKFILLGCIVCLAGALLVVRLFFREQDTIE